MSLPISTSIDDVIGLDVFCRCGRTGYVSAESARKLDTTMSFKDVAFHLVCSACGAKGGGALEVRFSIKDYYAWARDHGAAIP